MHDNITKIYKHGSGGTISQIDDELKHISNNLGIGDRIEQMKKREAFISLKHHKGNFENKNSNTISIYIYIQDFRIYDMIKNSITTTANRIFITLAVRPSVEASPSARKFFVFFVNVKWTFVHEVNR